MRAGDVKVSRIPHRSAAPSLRTPKKAVALSSDCSRSHPSYAVHFVLFVLHDGFAFLFLALGDYQCLYS